ncbi:hypothetical protein THAOC_00291 [Thalassiosira oceanica]|uniref:Uncharacterized protein n=1 Tax=Thalassiosira oceanica TaxID=159749 RepID=K0TRI3_THAOC|nr:hypothetical protein THAOC_00291 [Thalassiosira oceanica]|eukprot:EJK77847.1 hypothetical protein THAOC_00291 [Thalassiosira oceanica]
MRFSLKKSGGDAPPEPVAEPKNDTPSSRSMFSFRSNPTDEGIEAEAMPLPPPTPPPAVAAAPETKKSRFSFGRGSKTSQESAPQPQPLPPAPLPAAAAAATPEKKSRFGFGRGSQAQSQAAAMTPETAAPTPSPPPVAATKRSMMSMGSDKGQKAKSTKKQQDQVSRQLNYDEAPKPKKRCCCSLKFLLASLCTLVLAAVGIVVWRYGPWSKDKSVVESLAVTTCDGCCNGSVANCALPVNEVLTGMVHRAHSSSSNGFVGASNARSLEDALVAGYRGLHLSTCTCESLFDLADNQLLERDPEWGLEGSNLGFCHQACGLGVRDPKDVLTNLKTFIETNAREVLILKVDMTGDSGTDFRTALRASGMLDHVYQPDGEYFIRTWPTLQALIDAGTRVLIFGSGDTMESCPARECEDKILYGGDHFIETSAEDGIETCDLNVSGEVMVAYMQMNHYDRSRFGGVMSDAADTNSPSTLEARFADCEGKRYPSILSVERWDEGGVLAFVSAENSKKNLIDREYSITSEERQDVEALLRGSGRR